MEIFRKGMFADIEVLKDKMCPIMVPASVRNKCEGDSCPMIREGDMIVNNQQIKYVYCGAGGKP